MAGDNGSPRFLTLDVGTTSVKIGLFNSSGDMLASALKEYSLETPSEDTVELEVELYWQCCREGIREVMEKTGTSSHSVRSIGVCSQGETLICLDRGGKPLRKAIVWMDNRSSEEAEELKRSLGTDNNTGQTDLIPTWPITKILWLKKNEPEVYAKTKRYLLVDDYILYRLTGKFKGEYALYTSSYMLDILNKKWWQEILDYVGVRQDQLVELCESGQIIGTLQDSVARDLGLSPDTAVVTGAMDQTSASIGAGSYKGGIVTETTGSALVICETLDAYPEALTLPMAVQYHAVPDRYLLLGWCASGGMSLKWLRDAFFAAERDRAEKQGRDTYDPLNALAREVPIGSQGLLFFPYMAGPGTLNIDPDARGVFYGLELHHGRAHFIRAIMESMAFVIREHIDAIEKAGTPCKDIRSLGGGSRSPLWGQIKADVTGRQIITMKCPEAASLGSAILQACALGIYPDLETATERMVQPASVILPESENHRKYEAVFQRYREVEERYFARK